MLRSGSICVNFLYNYLISEATTVNKNEDGGDILIKKATKLKCLSDTFQSYGGVLAKLSQIICLGENDKDNSVFSDCKPFSTEKTTKYIKQLVENETEYFKDVNNINYNVYKSGSIGQVHKATYKNNRDIIIKVQYVGLKEQVKTDLFILDTLITYLYSFANLTNAISDIKYKIEEELDYTIEYHNQQLMYDNWTDHEYIKIAELIPSISNEKILSMYFIEGENLNDFIQNSTQEERNNIGMLIVEFVFTNIYKYNILYSDIHYGNFLIQDKKILYVMDFGCINDVDDTLHENLTQLYIAMVNDDVEAFYYLVEKMEIIDENIPADSKEYIYEYFKRQYEPWLSDNFEFTIEWVNKTSYKNTELMKYWNLPSNLVYFNKIPYGFFHILARMNLKGNFLTFYKKILNL